MNLRKYIATLPKSELDFYKQLEYADRKRYEMYILMGLKRDTTRDDFKTPTEWYADRDTLTTLEDIGDALGIDKRSIGKYLERGLAKIRHIIFKNPHKYRDLVEHIQPRS